MKIVAFVLAVAMLTPGCYFGHQPHAKTAAYIANGAVAAGGAALIVDGAIESHRCQQSDTCWIDLSGAVIAVGLLALTGGLIGTAINANLEPAHDAPRPHQKRPVSALDFGHTTLAVAQ